MAFLATARFLPLRPPELAVGDATYWANAATCYERDGRPAEAAAAWEDAVLRNPRRAEYRFARSDALLAAGADADALLDAAWDAKRAFPDRWEADVRLAAAQSAGASDAEAIRSYLRALELSPGNAQALLGLGILYGQAGEHELARATLGEGLRSRPQDPDLWLHYGLACRRAGFPEEAAAWLDRYRERRGGGGLGLPERTGGPVPAPF